MSRLRAILTAGRIASPHIDHLREANKPKKFKNARGFGARSIQTYERAANPVFPEFGDPPTLGPNEKGRSIAPQPHKP
jgi:hypothetical protein